MRYLLLMILALFSACGSSYEGLGSEAKGNVIAVDVNGISGSYSFAVTLQSEETGCDQYADWWEVLAEDGSLLYRRILYHSHPTDQPFKRSGGSVRIGAQETVYVRAHMNTSGYNGDVFKGSVQGGFTKSSDTIAQSDEVILSAPQPNGCAF